MHPERVPALLEPLQGSEFRLTIFPVVSLRSTTG